MKTVGFRSIVLYILLLAFLGGIGYFTVNLLLHGGQWAMQPYNGHLSANMGDITDRNGNLLATSQDGERIYAEDETVRRALLHTVGDPYGYISVSTESTMSAKLSGYNLITGLNDTVLSSLGRNVQLTVDRDACAAAYRAMNGRSGGAILYNYKTGEVLVRVSAPTFDPGLMPDDIETNDAYKGAYLDNTLSGSFTPGSIFKLVTLAAAMERWPDSWSDRTYQCYGREELGGSDITCLRGEAHGTQDAYSALGNSCNVYFAHLAADLGAETLQAQAEKMGFNAELSFGSIPIAESTIDLSGCNQNQLGWAGVGQYTVLANPYHMMVLMGAIAGGGQGAEPRMTESSDLFGSLTDSGAPELVSSTTAAQLKAMMRSNVQHYYGDWLFPEGMNVCAKTGTGEVGEGKGPNCWMVGFCDSLNSPYAFAVVVEEGDGGIETAGTVVSAMLSNLAE